MTKDIAPAVPVSGAVDALRHASLPPSGQRSPGLARVDRVLTGSTVGRVDTAISASQAIDRAIEAAARETFANRNIAVTSFQDEGSGRFVHRVIDRETGQVLMQSPPDEMLRFFATGRQPPDRPFVDLDV